jgi:ABC-2 type transport system permease protein
MVTTDFKVRYQGSALGYLWSLLRPLLLFAILYVVFVYIFKLNKGVPHYGAYLLLGIVLWTFFMETTVIGMSSVVSKGDLIRKISIPRYLVVVSGSISALINLGFNLLVVLFFAIVNGVEPSISWILIIPIIMELFIFSLAVSFILSAFYVKFRDVVFIWEVAIQAGFYATPILYSISLVPVQYRAWVFLNPLAQIIQDARYSLITNQTIVSWNTTKFRYAVIPIIIVFIVSVFSLIYFRKQSKNFAENI